MKKIIFFLAICSSFLFAQEAQKSSSVLPAQDTIKIAELVQQQIEAARMKQTTNAASVSNFAEKRIEIQVQSVITAPQVRAWSDHFFNAPLHLKIFSLTSIAILLFVFIRRAVLRLNKKRKLTIKQKIAMIREEKVVPRINYKIKKTRKYLKDKHWVFNSSEKHLSKAAKELNIAKGEVLLAARLKLFEVGKM